MKNFLLRLYAAALMLFVNLRFALTPLSAKHRTCDVAFPYRMGAGFAGDINRTNPFSALQGLINTTTPPRAYGDPVLVNAADNTLRGLVPGDNNATAAAVYGITVRPYPTQQQSGGMGASIGPAVPPTSGMADFLRQGFIMVKLPAGAVVAKGSQAFIWCAATASTNIQGGFVATASAGNTLPVSNAAFTGPADATGIAELEVWPAR